MSSRSKQVIISPDKPFVVIGERINPTRRKKLMETMASGDFSIALEDARNQLAAGAQVLDVNAGIPAADEPAILSGLAQALAAQFDVPLCFDSANPRALDSALSTYSGKALINSTTGEGRMLESVLPLAKKYGAAVIGVLTDEAGIPATPEGRLAVAKKIISRAEEHGIPAADVIIDCLALPVGAQWNSARVSLDTLALVKSELGVNMSLGASNVSFGMPDRGAINAAYLALAIARGLTAAITDPTVPEIHTTVLACDLLMARDPHAVHWIKAYRESQKAAPKA